MSDRKALKEILVIPDHKVWRDRKDLKVILAIPDRRV